MTGTGAAMIAAPGATCGAPKRGWNGGSKPSRPRERRANAAMPRERAKSSRKRGVSWRCDEPACAKSERSISREACSGALRRSEFVSRASSTCLRPVAGGSLRPSPVLDAGGWTPAARARGSTATARVPAVPGRGIGRRSRALDPTVTCGRGSLPPAPFPECSGNGPWRVDAQAWQNRTSINRQRALLTAPVPHWQAEPPRLGGNGFPDAGRAP